MAKETKKSNFLIDLLQAQELKNGPEVYIASESEKLLAGVPLPSLSLMYMFDANVLLLSRAYGVAGKPAAQKSSFGTEISRWVADTGGYSALVECEGGKFSPTLIKSILREHYDNDRMTISQCASIDDGQTALTSMLKGIKAHSDRDQLFAFILDSLTGSDMEDTSDKIMKEGFADRAFPAGALSWTSFLKTYTAALIGWPVVLVYINHLKEKPASMPGMPPKKHTPGGDAQRFHASTYLYLDRIGTENKQSLEVNGEVVESPCEIRTIQIHNAKSSMGTDARKITVDFIWYYDDNNQQLSYFDWDTSTAEFLVFLQGEKSKSFDKKKLKDIIDVSVTSNRYTSHTLGLKGVSGAALGRAVHQNAELMATLMRFLHIKEYPIYSGCMPKLDADKMRKALQTRQEERDDLKAAEKKRVAEARKAEPDQEPEKPTRRASKGVEGIDIS